MSTSLRNPWFRRYPVTERPSARLVGFHHAGGSASQFRMWRASLPAWIEIIGVQLPGRENRLGEAPFRSAVQVIDELERQVAPLFDVPVYFFGHSMGAMIAFELTRSLRRASRPAPAHLFLSGRWAAHLSDPLPRLSVLPHEEFIDAMRRLEGTPAEVFAHRELVDLVVPLLRADFELCENYRYQPEAPLGIPITAFGGLDDAAVPAASVEHWSAHTTGVFRSRLLAGGHFFVNSARSELLAEISLTIESSVRGAATVASLRVLPTLQNLAPTVDRRDQLLGERAGHAADASGGAPPA